VVQPVGFGGSSPDQGRVDDSDSDTLVALFDDAYASVRIDTAGVHVDGDGPPPSDLPVPPKNQVHSDSGMWRHRSERLVM